MILGSDQPLLDRFAPASLGLRRGSSGLMSFLWASPGSSAAGTCLPSMRLWIKANLCSTGKHMDSV